jgi:aspartyl/glutamyl-tRNA(Asn/Gln) amidotransferase C subunit
VDIEELQKTARLANLELTAEEAEEFTGQLGGVFERFAALDEVSVEGVEPLTAPPRPPAELRRDSVRPGLPGAGPFRVPRVLEEGR